MCLGWKKSNEKKKTNKYGARKGKKENKKGIDMES